MAIDHHIALRIRERRIAMGLTQRQLGQMIGLTGTQVQKYEHGLDRVSAGFLYKIAGALSSPLEYFYQGLREEVTFLPALRGRFLMETIRTFDNIKNKEHRKAFCQLVRALAER
jgi:transcriptional regulator with XRE-family HTH domain